MAKKENSFLNLLITYDEKVTEKFNLCSAKDSMFGYLRPYMKLIEISCHGIPWLVCSLGIAFLNYSSFFTQFSCNLFNALIFDVIIVSILKALVKRPRPKANNMDMFATYSVDVFSFPSGHSTRAIMLLFIFNCKSELGFPLNAIILAWSLIVCLSRVLLGRHHVGDVLVGMTVGYFNYLVISYFWLSIGSCRTLMNMLYNVNYLDDDIDL